MIVLSSKLTIRANRKFIMHVYQKLLKLLMSNEDATLWVYDIWNRLTKAQTKLTTGNSWIDVMHPTMSMIAMMQMIMN